MMILAFRSKTTTTTTTSPSSTSFASLMRRAMLVVALTLSVVVAFASDDRTCSLTPEEAAEIDPALREMTYDVGDGPQKTMVYVEPDVTSFYKLYDHPPAQTKVEPKFNGFSGKFINMSNKHVTLYWEDRPGGKAHVMRHHQPFHASGTATFPGHRFFFAEKDNPKAVLHRIVIQPYPENVYVYDPYKVVNDPEQTNLNLSKLTKKERQQYEHWRRTLSFSDQYKAVTGRTYLANYLRKPPMHYMWRADYFGQEHWITTKETHFVSLPPVGDERLRPITTMGTDRILKDSDPRILQEFRDPLRSTMNMTLRVLSCAPRVFEIENFLSPAEVQHILELAGGINLKLSSTGDISKGDEVVEEESRRTRTSYNSWVMREKSPVIDAVYRRGADLMRVDEALMRFRSPGKEWTNLTSIKPLAEQLQLVHYDVGQEYTAHHDFGFARIDDDEQGARFSTLLLYLNGGMEGGDTSFPRWSNAETFDQLKVPPVAGKAVLFYSQLPDGNMDDLSHHAALPIRDGEKWLINLWFWDPVYDY